MLKGGVGNTGISALGIEPEYARQRCWPNAHTLSTHSTAPTYTGFRNLFFSASHITQCYYVVKDYVAFLQVIMHQTLVLKHFLHCHSAIMIYTFYTAAVFIGVYWLQNNSKLHSFVGVYILCMIIHISVQIICIIWL